MGLNVNRKQVIDNTSTAVHNYYVFYQAETIAA
jgi:hypothetical protein